MSKLFNVGVFVLVSPALIGLVDLYCFFFFGSQLTRIDWNQFTVMFALITAPFAVLFEFNSKSNCNGFCGEYECKENQPNCKRIKR